MASASHTHQPKTGSNRSSLDDDGSLPSSHTEYSPVTQRHNNTINGNGSAQNQYRINANGDVTENQSLNVTDDADAELVSPSIERFPQIGSLLNIPPSCENSRPETAMNSPAVPNNEPGVNPFRPYPEENWEDKAHGLCDADGKYRFSHGPDGEPLTCFLIVSGFSHEKWSGDAGNSPLAWIAKGAITEGNEEQQSMIKDIVFPTWRCLYEVYLVFNYSTDAYNIKNLLRGYSHKGVLHGEANFDLPVAPGQSIYQPVIQSVSFNQFVHGAQLPFECLNQYCESFRGRYDGQVIVHCSPFTEDRNQPGALSWEMIQAMKSRTKEMLQNFGPIRVFFPFFGPMPTAMFVVEFASPDLASDLVDLSRAYHHGIDLFTHAGNEQSPIIHLKVWATHYTNEIADAPRNAGNVYHDERDDHHVTAFQRRWNTPKEARLPISALGIDPMEDREGHRDAQGRKINTAENRGRNFVSLRAISMGTDVRTTVMLRNIPNRMDHDTLKLLLDEHVFGQYDFLYLRIDFANNCNVGYAFINFATGDSIKNFVEKTRGRKWQDLRFPSVAAAGEAETSSRANSDKVAEVSWATMQGKETLIQKFRNSSVMQEHPSSRPKLYYLFGHPLVGTEEPFPPPDNLLKLARSTANAAHIGPSRYERLDFDPPFLLEDQGYTIPFALVLLLPKRRDDGRRIVSYEGKSAR
ncbi:MAG: hypothetical protein M1831_002894 [Alyxoria varia]|nr:MAG: hypothetical protein M1831_002894 [Alyxoria varia]